MKDKKIKTVIVTGGYGFIGSRFVNQLLESTSYHVKIIDKLTYAGDKGRVNIKPEYMGRVSHIRMDICDISEYIFDEVEYIVNFAAESHVDNSIKDGKPFIRSNIEGVFNLLEKSKNIKGIKKFIQISTDEVYGDMDDLRGVQYSDESFKLRPSSYYSATKASADLLVQAASRTFGIPYIITRSCNNFGPGQDPEKFIPTVFKSIKEGKKIPVYGDGLQSREWIHVDDNVQIILELMLSGAKNEVYNIGSGHHYTNMEIVEFIAHLLPYSTSTYEHVADRLGHDRAYRLDTQKVDSLLVDRVYYCLDDFLRDEVSKSTNISNGS
tara:strand:- start:3600 stop:4571 length:972 start_codon:yes stop_codon:yes gene_type:complete